MTRFILRLRSKEHFPDFIVIGNLEAFNIFFGISLCCYFVYMLLFSNLLEETKIQFTTNVMRQIN